MPPPGQPYASLRDRILGERGVIMLIGGADTGKTTLGKLLAADGLSAGMTVAYVDADINSATVGPPACVGLRWINGPTDMETLYRADELRFVGSTEPNGVVLPHVVATAALVDLARSRADLVIVDTTSAASGVVGQTLKYHLVELADPALVIAMQRGREMEPTIGMLQRFLGARIARSLPHEGLSPLGPIEQRARRIEAFREALPAPIPRWRAQSGVFAPTLPEEFDLSRLDAMVVGVQDGEGRCLGLGVLEFAEGYLRVVTHHGEAMKGLRLGSLKLDLESYETVRIRLRQLILGV